jgi:peptidoglycan/xylan/chitin deacetylase (PgdA/CDA1 family)
MGLLEKTKMKNLKFIFLLVGALLLLVFLGKEKKGGENQISQPTPTPQVVKESGFAAAIAEAEKREAEKRKQEETRQFIAKYGPCRNIPILMYHHIGDKQNWLYVRPEIFRQQMDYLLEKGYNTVTLQELVAALNSGISLPAKPIVLTFDDGYRDFFTNAFPILRERNLKATVFVITQLVDGEDYLTWEQLREIKGSGLITIGDHTLSHKDLAALPEEEIRSQILDAKNILENNLGGKTEVFAYPYGDSNNKVTKVLQEGGFLAAVRVSRGLACAKLPFSLPRIRIGNASLSSYGL